MLPIQKDSIYGPWKMLENAGISLENARIRLEFQPTGTFEHFQPTLEKVHKPGQRPWTPWKMHGNLELQILFMSLWTSRLENAWKMDLEFFANQRS